ncbi:MAG: outer membrane beta-barrel protein [Phycisphaeraceae bacterium]
MKRHVALTVLMATIINSAAYADVNDEPFGFRFNMALDRVSVYTDVLGRQASAAHPLGSSHNPGAKDFLRKEPFTFNVVGGVTTNQVAFERGAWIESIVGVGSYRFPEPTKGTINVIYVRSDTQDGTILNGDLFLRNNKVGVAYGYQINESLGVGGNVTFTDTQLDIIQPTTIAGLGTFTSQVESESLGVDFQLGVLYALNEQWSVGLTGGAGWAWSDDVVSIFTPAPPFGAGTITLTTTNLTESVNIRGGVGYRPKEFLGIYADLQYLHFEDDDNGTADVARAFLGGEMFLPGPMALRVGTSLDTAGNASIGANIGYYGFKHVALELAYQYNAFPEINREFGHAHLVSFGLIFLF